MIRKRGWDKNPSLSIVFGLSSKTQWLSGLYYADFISFYSPTQLCGGGTTKSNSNELPISVPLSFYLILSLWTYNLKKKKRGPSYANHVKIHFVSHYLSPSKLFLNSKGGWINHHAFDPYFNLPYSLLIHRLLTQR